MKNLIEVLKVELYLSSKNGRLNNKICTANKGQVGLKEFASYFIDDIINVEKVFKVEG